MDTDDGLPFFDLLRNRDHPLSAFCNVNTILLRKTSSRENIKPPGNPFLVSYYSVIKSLVIGIHHSPITIHHLPFTNYHSPFTIHQLPFTNYHSPFTIYHSPFTIHHLPITIHHLPFTIYQLPFTNYHLPFTIYHLPLLQVTKNQSGGLRRKASPSGLAEDVYFAGCKSGVFSFCDTAPKKPSAVFCFIVGKDASLPGSLEQRL